MGKSASGKDTMFKGLLELLPLRTIVPYTTRPIREGEKDGVEYFFVKEEQYRQMERDGNVIEARTYDTVYGPWTYFTADDGQVQLSVGDYLVIGTLESFVKTRQFYGEQTVVPLFLQLDDGLRLTRALEREKAQKQPRYAEMCRRFLADEQDFSKEKLALAGIEKTFSSEDRDHCLKQLVSYIKKQA